jgi:hypothetical protein
MPPRIQLAGRGKGSSKRRGRSECYIESMARSATVFENLEVDLPCVAYAPVWV